MEDLRSRARFSAQPIITGLAILFTLVLGLIGGYALAGVGESGKAGSPAAAYSAPATTLAPDAQERNDNLRGQQLSKDSTHGH